jgi:hypothetical protein
MSQVNQDTPLDAAGVAKILEEAAERLRVYQKEPLGTVVPPNRKEYKDRHGVNIACAFGGQRFFFALDWLRFHGYAATADELKETYSEILKETVTADLPVLNGTAATGSPCEFIRLAAGVAANQLARVAMLVRQNQDKKSTSKRRLSRETKLALVAEHIRAHPNATSTQIAQATGIDAGDVRNIWGPIKKAFKEGKVSKPRGWKTNDGRTEAVASSTSCSICDAPLPGTWECKLCKEIIECECKTCHSTNRHPDEAEP